jgi:hypothetical protein
LPSTSSPSPAPLQPRPPAVSPHPPHPAFNRGNQEQHRCPSHLYSLLSSPQFLFRFPSFIPSSNGWTLLAIDGRPCRTPFSSLHLFLL